MSSQKTIFNKKLFGLREWLNLSETAQYLSSILGEDVKESDILRLGLDGHLTLSVNFINEVYVRKGEKLLTFEEWKMSTPLGDSFENDPQYNEALEIIRKQSKKTNGKMLPTDESFMQSDVIAIKGIYDLPLVCNERQFIQEKYHLETYNIEVEDNYPMNPSIIADMDGITYQLQERFPENWIQDMRSPKRIKETLDRYREQLNADVAGHKKTTKEADQLFLNHKRRLEDKREQFNNEFFPAKAFPDDCILVVRTAAIHDFIGQLINEKPLKTNEFVSEMLDTTHRFHSNELKIAAEAWTELYSKNPPQQHPQGGHIVYITKWLKRNYPDLSQRAIERLSKIINPNRKGGASPTE